MAAINGVELSNEAQAALHEMISRMSAAHIAQLAGKIPGGFREPKAIRSYLLQQCKARSELNPLVKGLLRGSWRPLQLVATLSAEALALCLSSLQGAFRPGEFSVALLLDERADVRNLNQRLTTNAGASSSPTEAIQAVKSFQDFVSQRLLNSFAHVVPAIRLEWVTDDMHQTGASTCDVSKIETAFAKCCKERDGFADAARRAKAQLQETTERERALREAQCSALEQELAAKNGEVGRMTAKLADLESKLADERAHRAQLVEVEVERRVSDVVAPWLAEGLRLKKMSAIRTDLDLEAKVSALLAQQKALDMKYGSWARLRQRLKDFEAYAEQLRNARQDSLRPHPELEPLFGQVESEIQKVRRALGVQEEPSPLIPKLLEAIQRSGSSDELDELGLHFEGLRAKGVFNYREEKRFVKRLHIAQDRLKYRETPQPEKPRLRSGRELRQVLGRNQLATIYIDGNNLLMNADGPYLGFLNDGKISQTAEEALIGDIVKVADKCPAVTFRIVFDSREPSEDQRTPNVVVQRSGGTGTDRSDAAIVSHLAKSDNQSSSYVVTEDRSLRDQAVKFGSVYATTAVWMVIAEAFGIQTPDEEAALSGATAQS
jgi:hypothetical protein